MIKAWWNPQKYLFIAFANIVTIRKYYIYKIKKDYDKWTLI